MQTDDRGIWPLSVVLTVTMCALAGWVFGGALLRFAVWVGVVIAVTTGVV